MANFDALVTALLLAVSAGTATAVMTPRLYCSDVYGNFSACLPYIEDVTSYVSPNCCDGVKMLNGVAKKEETAGWRRICLCIENLYENGVHPFSYPRIQLLPQACNARLSFPISESMNCTA